MLWSPISAISAKLSAKINIFFHKNQCYDQIFEKIEQKSIFFAIFLGGNIFKNYNIGPWT
jgi:hypothetical protein